MIKENVLIHLGKIDISPEAAGFNPAKLDQLDAFFANLVWSQKLQCASYLLSRNGKIFAVKSMGKLIYHEGSADFMPDSIRWIASITKSITAIAIMKLVEEGKLYLDQPVMTILDEFNTPVHSGIHIFHLLTHTSGIRGDTGYFGEPYPLPKKDLASSQNWIKETLEGPVQAEVGTAWIYATANYRILGEIISRVSGMGYEDYVTENILKPLTMDRSFFTIPKRFHDQVCLVGPVDEKKFLTADDSYPQALSAGGGLSSTLYDLWKLGQMMLGKGTFNDVQILGRKTVETMTRNHLTEVPAYYWGSKIKAMQFALGWHLVTQDLASQGTFSSEGYGRSAFYIDPVEQFIAIYFVPTSISWFAESMINPRAFMWSGLI